MPLHCDSIIWHQHAHQKWYNLEGNPTSFEWVCPVAIPVTQPDDEAVHDDQQHDTDLGVNAVRVMERVVDEHKLDHAQGKTQHGWQQHAQCLPTYTATNTMTIYDYFTCFQNMIGINIWSSK